MYQPITLFLTPLLFGTPEYTPDKVDRLTWNAYCSSTEFQKILTSICTYICDTFHTTHGYFQIRVNMIVFITSISNILFCDIPFDDVTSHYFNAFDEHISVACCGLRGKWMFPQEYLYNLQMSITIHATTLGPRSTVSDHITMTS